VIYLIDCKVLRRILRKFPRHPQSEGELRDGPDPRVAEKKAPAQASSVVLHRGALSIVARGPRKRSADGSPGFTFAYAVTAIRP